MSASYFWIERIAGLILELIMVIIFFIYGRDWFRYLRKTFKKASKSKYASGSQIFRKLCHFFTILTLFIYILQGGNYVLNSWSVYPITASCTLIKILSVLLYHYGKLSLYMVFVFRVKIAFHGSVYEQNPLVKYSLYFIYFLLISFFLTATLGDSLTVTGTLSSLNDETSELYYCLLDPLKKWGLAMFVGLDFIISVLCVAVFNYPLKLMLKSSDRKDFKIAQLTKKYSILSAIAICSTFVLSLAVALVKLGWLSLLDNIINSSCLLLMSSWYIDLFKKICCCFNFKDKNPTHLQSKNGTVENSTHSTMVSRSVTPNPAPSPLPTSTSTIEIEMPTGYNMDQLATPPQSPKSFT